MKYSFYLCKCSTLMMSRKTCRMGGMTYWKRRLLSALTLTL